MNRWMVAFFSFVVLVLVAAVDREEAGAYSIVLDDSAGSVERWENPLLLSPGTYRFNLSYWMVAEVLSGQDQGSSGPPYYDTFAYALLSGPDSDPANVTNLFFQYTVDIIGSIPQGSPATFSEVFTASAAEPFHFPAFVLSDNVAENTATIYVDYDIERVGAPVPEPSTFLLLGGGLLCVYRFSRRRT